MSKKRTRNEHNDEGPLHKKRKNGKNKAPLKMVQYFSRDPDPEKEFTVCLIGEIHAPERIFKRDHAFDFHRKDQLVEKPLEYSDEDAAINKSLAEHLPLDPAYAVDGKDQQVEGPQEYSNEDAIGAIKKSLSENLPIGTHWRIWESNGGNALELKWKDRSLAYLAMTQVLKHTDSLLTQTVTSISLPKEFVYRTSQGNVTPQVLEEALIEQTKDSVISDYRMYRYSDVPVRGGFRVTSVANSNSRMKKPAAWITPRGKRFAYTCQWMSAPTVEEYDEEFSLSSDEEIEEDPEWKKVLDLD